MVSCQTVRLHPCSRDVDTDCKKAQCEKQHEAGRSASMSLMEGQCTIRLISFVYSYNMASCHRVLILPTWQFGIAKWQPQSNGTTDSAIDRRFSLFKYAGDEQLIRRINEVVADCADRNKDATIDRLDHVVPARSGKCYFKTQSSLARQFAYSRHNVPLLYRTTALISSLPNAYCHPGTSWQSYRSKSEGEYSRSSKYLPSIQLVLLTTRCKVFSR